MDKKAFEIQFNWIFVLVAGTAILLFFALVVAKQKSISETSTKATILKSLNSIITGTGVSTDTINIINIPDSEIEVGCSRISLGGVSKQYQNLVLFAPSMLKGDKLITQTTAFSAPYRATNLLYMTSPQARYILVGSSSLAYDINKSLPGDINKEFYQSLPEIKNENNYKVRFVVFGDMVGFPKALQKMPDSDVTAVKVNGNSEKGTVEFWQKNGNSWAPKGSSAYIGKQSLIGVVYTDASEAYECNMQNAFSRLNMVTKIYMGKTRELAQRAAAQCSQFYANALSHLNSIFAASSGFNRGNVDTLADSAKSLDSDNTNARLYSCPFIY